MKMYKANKMGLLNFWLYDDEEFTFGDGKLLLRGQNGSGKSVTMQSFIPLILDGNKSPKRLDTFGSTDKHIEYYLLGDNKDEATSYLYMEFYDDSLDKYITIGIYLHTRRGRNVDFCGFCLKDGKRVNVNNFHLYKCIDGINKIPLTKLELKSAIGPVNTFVETAKEYKSMVNDLLFGFSSIDSFDEFINLLLQIRSPKLSKEYTPTKLMDTLNEVLPPLSDEDIRPLSEGIENINEYKERLEKTKREIKNLGNFILAFNNYNKGILKKKIKNLLTKNETLENEEKNYKTLQKNLKAQEDELKKAKAYKDELDKEYDFAKSKRNTLNLGELEKSTNRFNEIERNLTDIKTELRALESKNSEVFKKKEDTIKAINDLEKKQESINSKIIELVNTSKLESQRINFNNYIELLNLALENHNFDVDTVDKVLAKKEEMVSACLELLRVRSNLELKINEVSIKYANIVKKQEELDIKLKDLSNEVESELEDLIRELKNLKDNNTELMVDDDTYRNMINTLDAYSKDKYLIVKELYRNCREVAKSNVQNQINSYQVEFNIKKLNMTELKEALDNLENTKEVFLEEDELVNTSTKKLEELNIKYTYFYQVVDFKENITEEERNKLEEVLYSSNILGSKIINPQDIKKIWGLNINYLMPSTFKKDNLTKYLVPVKNDYIDEGYIKKILESISISNKDELSVNLEGFKFDFFKGNISNTYENKYIGLLARENLRQKRIANLKEEIDVLKKKMDSIQGIISSLNSKINRIDEEFIKFPKDLRLAEIEKEMSKINLNIDSNNEEINNLSDELNDFQKELVSLNKNINDYRGDIPLNLASYEEASRVIKTLNKYSNDLRIEFNRFLDNKVVLESKESQRNEYQVRISECSENISKNNKILDKLLNEKRAIEEVINSKENINLKDEILRLDSIINNYNSKNSEICQKIGGLESSTSSTEELISSKDKMILEDKALVKIAKSILDEEIKLGYIKYLEIGDLREKEYTIADIKQIFKKLENINLDNIETNYYQAINNYRQELIDYNLKDINIFTDNNYAIKEYSNIGIDLEKIIEEFKITRRGNVTFTFQGKIVNPYLLNGALNDKYDADKTYLDEQDKELFYNTLVKITGEKIKKKILLAEEWVKNTNKIMEEHGQDSNLSFHLEWHPKEAETTEEMNTKDLVNLFRKDVNTIKDEDIRRLVNHFRSKIDRAEEDNDLVGSYFQVISDVLDYRNWFQFKLFYRKDGSDRKELTNKIFSVFSGGEKAKTMYVPLFASVYAKLNAARNSAPRLIAMDEAFAGVDDQNIEEMFGILNSFNLDYLLTSQILWCTYSNVSSINISELIHPRGATSIGIHRYHWDGKVKTYLVEGN